MGLPVSGCRISAFNSVCSHVGWVSTISLDSAWSATFSIISARICATTAVVLMVTHVVNHPAPYGEGWDGRPDEVMYSVRKLVSNAVRTNISRVSSEVFPVPEKLSDEEKIECVLNDPKFGMFSLMSVCDEVSSTYCSSTFTTLFALPICVFLAQWAMFVGLMVHKLKSEVDICPQNATVEGKMVMVGIALIYFVNSFFQWDNVVSRRRQPKVFPSDNVLVLLDVWQEFVFNLLVYVANLAIIYTTDDVLEMLFNSLAMDFVTSLDNEFERTYFNYHPELAVRIYDEYFVTAQESCQKRKSRKDCLFRSALWITYIPFKLLNVCFALLPVFCAVMIVFGAVCK